MSTTRGTVTLVGAGPSADLITVAGLRALQAADVVITDRLLDASLLEGLRDDVYVVDAGKAPAMHKQTQDEINALLVQYALEGCNVVRLKGGDPFVFGRGGEEVLACRAAGVEVRVIPGVSSAIAAPALADIPVTHRGVAPSFTVVSAQSRVDFEVYAKVGGTLVFLMGVGKLGEIVDGLVRGGLASSTGVAFIENAYHPDQRVTRTTLALARAAAEEVGLRSPAVIVVGDVVDVLSDAGVVAFAA